VEVRIRVEVSGTGEEREVRCTIPELAKSRLHLELARGVRFLQTVGRRGAQWLRESGPKLHLEADLGRVGSLHVRWREDGGPTRAAAVQVREAYFWSLRAPSARLLAVLEYTVTSGATARFTLDLPNELEVRTVEAVAVNGPAPRLRKWSLLPKGPGRQVQLEFQTPVTDGVRVLLELVPGRPVGPSFPLVLPRPQGDEPAGGGLLAFRVEDWEWTVANDYRAVTGLRRPDEFTRLWTASGAEDVGPPSNVYRFRRASTGAPFVRLVLQPPAVRAAAALDVSWRVGPGQAEVQATARLTARVGRLILVQWHVPSEVAVTEVSGPAVRHWTRNGSRVQVWLRQPLREATLYLTGLLPLPLESAERGAPTAPGPDVALGAGHSARAPFAFDLPGLWLTAVPPHPTWVHVTTGPELALAPTTLRNLLPLPDLRRSDRQWDYVARPGAYAGRFQVRPAATAADVRVFTFAEVRDDRLRFAATLECRPRGGELRTLTVHLKNWDGDVLLQAPEVASRREHRRDPAGRTWTLELVPGVTGPYRFILSGSLPLEAHSRLVLPDVRVEGTARQERWLGVSGPDLAADEPQGVRAVPLDDPALATWPQEASRLRGTGGTAWKVEADAWRLRVLPGYPVAGTAPVQVFLTELAAAVVDGRRWVHQATYWLYHEAGTDLSIELPAAATVLAVAIDGTEVTPLQPARERLWLPLPGRAGARAVRFRWVYQDGLEPVARPNLERPRLDAVAEDLTGWTVHVPAGYHLVSSGSPARPAGAAERELLRAYAQLLLSRALVERMGGSTGGPAAAQLPAVQERFYRACRLAESWLALPGEPRAGAGPQGQSLADWLQELKAANSSLARQYSFERVRAHAEQQGMASAAQPAVGDEPLPGPGPGQWATGPSDPLTERGTPTYWWAAAAAAPPSLSLRAEWVQQLRRSLAATGLMLLLAASAWGLAQRPRAVAWFRALWPEQLALLGWVGWAGFGLSWPAALFVLLGLGSRLFLLGRWGLAYLLRPAPAAAASGSASGSPT
jgi:hypothetical protein